MKLIKLEILNLASLDRQDGEVIHFEEGALKDSTIFSIVGPTGSGKSTLLDAICLALYNRAPRYPRQKGARNQNIEIYGEPNEEESRRLAPTDCRNILTRGRKQGYSKLTFLANNGQIYRAEWQVKFNHLLFAPVVTRLYQLSLQEGKVIEKEREWEELPKIIGLDYEQFLRTVLIAQGSFANFLTAKENERYELLEKLIGCEEQYASIAMHIKEKRDEATQSYNAIHTHLAVYEKDLLAEEELQTLQKEIERLEQADKQVKEELVKINEALLWYTTEAQQVERLQHFQQRMTQAQQVLEEAKPLFQQLQLHDLSLPAIHLYRDGCMAKQNLRQQREKLAVLQEQIKRQSLRQQQEEQKLQELQDTEIHAATLLEKQRPHINQARIWQGELEGARRTVIEKERAKAAGAEGQKKAEQELTANESNLEQGRTNLEKTQRSYYELQKEIEQKKTALAEEAKEAAKAFQMIRQQLVNIDANVLQKAKEQADRQLNQLKEAIRLVEESARKQQERVEGEAILQQLTARNRLLEKELKELSIEGLTSELETLSKTHTLMTSEQWKLHRQNLIEGKPCPLCGAIVHPYAQQETWMPVINELQALIRKKKAQLDEQVQKRQQFTQEWGENHGKLQQVQKELQRLLLEERQWQENWKNIQTLHTDWLKEAEWLKAKLPEITAEGERASQALAVYHRNAAEAEKRRQVLEKCEQTLKLYTEQSDHQMRLAEQKQTEAHTWLKTEAGKTEHLKAQAAEKALILQQAIQEEQAARQVVEEKEKALRTEIGLFTPDELEQQLTQAKNKATEAVNRQNLALHQLREQLKGYYGQQEVTAQMAVEEEKKIGQLQTDLKQWLHIFQQKYPELYLSEEDISRLATATDNWEDIRRRQTELQMALNTARTTLLNEQEAHHKHQEKKPSQMREELSVRKTELEAVSNEALTDAKARLQRHCSAQEQMGQLFNQQQQAEQLKRAWNEITDAIGSDGKTLRKIAQCYTLRFLIEHANVEIRKFNSRYELQQVKNSLGIRVIDHDRGDDIRDTTSLSGGETFIVSLGLALGLSALSSRNISFENLFIDEGFGTLDPETLSTVIDSLAMLQTSQGKKVGVISHTDTMSERITTQIRIIKNGNSGSSHLEIYPK